MQKETVKVWDIKSNFPLNIYQFVLTVWVKLKSWTQAK